MTPSISVTVFLTPVRCKVNSDPELESADSTVRAGVGYAETRAAGFNDGSWPLALIRARCGVRVISGAVTHWNCGCV